MAVDTSTKAPNYDDFVYVTQYKHKSGKIMRASDYGLKCFVFKNKRKKKKNS